ncbi:uncharacterized protein LOC113874202 [Abrus precatorius]|uniref:Uncharacterized protein LOC113874202 n=1 Tax=Abrus precatorius TaxID=3816 RepID=A0A8B8MKU1_ABRPR|nr:uncharacterized protein LOC113874202 [Abrus precatorius]
MTRPPMRPASYPPPNVNQMTHTMEAMAAIVTKSELPQFTGIDGPDAIEVWIREIEKIFITMGCAEDKNVVYATSGRCRDVVVGSPYYVRGSRKFFPPHVRAAKEREFLTLVQGNSSVYEYVIQFEWLYRFYSHPTSEKWRCQRFSDGVRTDIKKTLIPLRITEFADLVDQATIIRSFNLENVGGVGKA